MLFPIYNVEERRVEWVTDNLETAYEDAVKLKFLKTYRDFLTDVAEGQEIFIYEITEGFPFDD